TILHASACPVVPVETSRYVGFFVCPPVYPEVTDNTPSNCLNCSSTHQKHPAANVAVSAVAVRSFIISFLLTSLCFACFSAVCCPQETNGRMIRANAHFFKYFFIAYTVYDDTKITFGMQKYWFRNTF